MDSVDKIREWVEELDVTRYDTIVDNAHRNAFEFYRQNEEVLCKLILALCDVVEEVKHEDADICDEVDCPYRCPQIKAALVALNEKAKEVLE